MRGWEEKIERQVEIENDNERKTEMRTDKQSKAIERQRKKQIV